MLDHILVTDGLDDAVQDIRFAHFDNEYYDRTLINDGAGCSGATPPPVCSDGHKVSDHDPPIVTFSLPAPPPTYAETVLDDDPVGYWRKGEAPGSTTLVDSSGNANNGVYQGGVTLGVPGALVGDPDTAASYDGINDIGRVADSNSLDGGASLTVEGWIKRSSTAKTHGMFLKGNNGVQLVVMAGSSQVFLRKTNVTTLARSEGGVPADGAFHHIVATVDGPNSARIYIDGVEDTVQVATVQSLQNTALPLLFGTGASTQATFDEFALYDEALSAAQVTQHFEAGSGSVAG